MKPSYLKPPRPGNERQRLAALREYRILDTGEERVYDDITELAAHICHVPMAMISLVDDARQETFRRVLITLKEKGGLASAESLGAFVNSVCNNVLFECYRAGAKVQQLAEDHDEAEGRPSVEARLMAAEDRDRVRDALAALPEKEREILRWIFFEERDKDEICRELNVDRNYLRVLVHRAKAKFKDRFLQEGVAEGL